MTNDSNSVRKDQSFEIALTEYRGKVYGYSRSEFIVNDTLYYIVKRVKGVIEGDMCEVKDDEIIAYNFPGKLDKGIKVSSKFYRNKQDSVWRLDGKWKTNQTKKFYSVTGKVDLKEEKDMELSRIFPHLEELKLASELPFYQESIKVKESIAKTRIRTQQQSGINEEIKIAGPSGVSVNTIQVSKAQTVGTSVAAPKKAEAIGILTSTTAEITMAELREETKRDKSSIKSEQQSTIDESIAVKQPSNSNVKVNTVPVKNTTVVGTSVTDPRKAGTVAIPTQTTKEVAKTEIRQEPKKEKTEVKSTTPPASIAAVPNPDKGKPIIETAPPKNLTFVDNAAAAQIKQRELPTAQVVNFTSDSLELALYDNGEIDGDTVSVLLNGELLLAKQRLKSTAIKKTIYITPGQEELTLVLYAENLGKYPPNTGLLVVHDGENVFNLRFSADLQKNAAVIFRRKK